MAEQRTAQDFVGHSLLDREGNHVGKIEQVFVDDRTSQPKWVSVQTGMFRSRHVFVPLQGARPQAEDLTVPYDRQMIKDSPRFDTDQHLSMTEEEELYQYYGVNVPHARTEPEAERMDHAPEHRPEQSGHAGTAQSAAPDSAAAGTAAAAGAAAGTAEGQHAQHAQPEAAGDSAAAADEAAVQRAAMPPRGRHAAPADESAEGMAAAEDTEGSASGTAHEPIPMPAAAPESAPHDSDSMQAERMVYEGSPPNMAGTAAAPSDESAAAPAAAPAADGGMGDLSMTRYEEQARVEVSNDEVGRARVRKTVEHQHFERDIPVSHEELRIERMPVTEADRAPDGTFQERDEEIYLYAEHATVTTESIPVEKIRITKESVSGSQHVEGELRRERIVIDGDSGFTTDDDAEEHTGAADSAAAPNPAGSAADTGQDTGTDDHRAT